MLVTKLCLQGKQLQSVLDRAAPRALGAVRGQPSPDPAARGAPFWAGLQNGPRDSAPPWPPAERALRAGVRAGYAGAHRDLGTGHKGTCVVPTTQHPAPRWGLGKPGDPLPVCHFSDGLVSSHHPSQSWCWCPGIVRCLCHCPQAPFLVATSPCCRRRWVPYA